MVKIFAMYFLIISKAFAIEVIIEENGHKKIVKIPDNGRSVVLKMHRGDSQKKDTISLRVDGSSSKKLETCKPFALKKKPASKKNLKKQKTLVIAPNREESPYYTPRKTKTVQTMNVYHYFYPCSANPGVKDCVPDNQIKIDNNTDRLVMVDLDGNTKKIDMIDQRIGEKSIVVDDGKPVIQDDLPRSSDPIFEHKNYQNRQVPTNDQYGTIIKPTYDSKKIAIVQNNEK